MTESSRRQFLGAAATLAGLPMTDDASSEENLISQGQLPDRFPASPSSPRKATPQIYIEDGPLHLERYPRASDPELADAELLAFTDHEGGVFVGATREGVEPRRRYVLAGFSLDPDTADFLAELLTEFAARAREGEDGEYNM